jgi:hypothetical protein
MTSTANIDMAIESLTNFLVKGFYGLFCHFRGCSGLLSQCWRHVAAIVPKTAAISEHSSSGRLIEAQF